MTKWCNAGPAYRLTEEQRKRDRRAARPLLLRKPCGALLSLRPDKIDTRTRAFESMSAEARRLLAKVPTGVVSSTVEEAIAAGAAACIGTHNGTFHCDEALATALLKTLPAYKDHAIVRTRDPEQLAFLGLEHTEFAVLIGPRRNRARKFPKLRYDGGC